MCKEIAPKEGWGMLKGKNYSHEFPKTVKSKFPVPEGWEELRSFKDGEPFMEIRMDLFTGEVVPVPITKTGPDGKERVFVHTCNRTLLQERGCGYHFYGWWVIKDGYHDKTGR